MPKSHIFLIKILMRYTRQKDPSYIGKLWSTQQLCPNCAKKVVVSPYYSSLLPFFKKHQNNSKQKISRAKPRNSQPKKSVKFQWEQESHQPLPQIKVTFNELNHNRKVKPINPEQQYMVIEKQVASSREVNYWEPKKPQLIGHFYSPKAKQALEYQKPQKKASRNKLDLKIQSKVENKKEKRSISSSKREGKIFQSKNKDKNSRLKERLNSSVGQALQFKERKKKKSLKPYVERVEQCTQSRMTEIGDEVNSDLKNLNTFQSEWKGQVMLKDAGQRGYVHAPYQKDQQQQGKNITVLLQQESSFQTKDLSPKSMFYLEGANGNDVVELSLSTTLSDLKILLIQSQQLKASISIPEIFLDLISKSTSQQQIHKSVQKIFSAVNIDISGQFASFKRYANCILVTVPLQQDEVRSNIEDSMAVLWHYTGRFYVGRWKKGYCDCEGFKCGLGMEYYPKGFVYYGTFDKNVRKGYGLMKKASKWSYLGEWADDKRCGWGKIFDPHGQMACNGYFQDGFFVRHKNVSE